ncbi:S8 family serine peptidase [Micromonospora profundi]|uniref:S8 family serine peptidase n=1 Tax=Micromonospora TaxID=1873 RepID=UPI0009E6A64F|nr:MULTISPECIES: S8 family serine peptidase [Micromonospora]NJC14987.1 type VII secretion-associated serine protease mycosin [Micromonospora profundi]
MRTGNRFRSARLAAAAAVALCAALVPAVVAPAPARAADTVRGLQWYLDSLKIPQAQKLTQGKGVVVAVIDGGVDASHPDLRGQVLAGHGVNAAAAPDGRRDDDREKGHGTSMAGIIAGRGGDQMRQLGIAPAAKILPVSMGARFNSDDVTRAVRWAADAGADVINLSVSIGDGAPPPDLADAITYAFSKDAVLVASAGNVEQGDQRVTSPANIPGVIAVSGLDKRGNFFAGSVRGPETVIAAPMESIIGPAPKAVSSNGYTVGSGTSSSAAIISGVVALVRAKYPQLDAANVINRLIKTARDAGPAGRDQQFGFGAVDPVAALTRSVPEVTANPLLEGATEPTRPGGAARPDDDEGPAVEFGVSNKAGAIVQVVLCVAVPIVALIVLLVVLRRRKRRTPAVPGPSAGAPGSPPPGWPAGPAGWQSPPGHVAPPQPVPGYGPPPAQHGHPPPGYPPPAGQPAPGYPPAAPPPGGPGWPGTGQAPPQSGPQQ